MPRKHVLMLVHGMGDYVADDGGIDPGWADRAEATLEEIYETYRILRIIPFAERFEVVRINYDRVFDDLLSKWAQQSSDLRESGVPIEGAVKRVFDWLDGGAQQDASFAWTHVADVVLYRFFRLVRQRVKIHVAKQMVAALKPSPEGSVTQWSVIAHSLGTIVAHDTLHALSTETPPEVGMPILDTMVPSATVFAAIANVSKVLETDAAVYDSKIVPPTTIDPNTAVFSYLSADHKLDPFLLAERFDPKADPEWKLAREQKTFMPVRTSNVHEVNVHSFANYLVNPDVHIPLFRSMAGPGVITEAERTAAKQAFEQVPSQTLLADAKRLSRESRAEDWFERIGKYYAQLKNGGQVQ